MKKSWTGQSYNINLLIAIHKEKQSKVWTVQYGLQTIFGFMLKCTWKYIAGRSGFINRDFRHGWRGENKQREHRQRNEAR